MSLHCSDKCHNTYSCSIVGYILIFSVSCIWLSLTFHISFQGTISTYPMQSESIIPKGSLYPLPCGRGLSSPFEPNEVYHVFWGTRNGPSISIQAQEFKYYSNSTIAFLAPIGVIIACVPFSI